MPSDSNSTRSRLVSSYEEELNSIVYGVDSATAAIGSSVTRDITRRNVQLGSSGNWEESSVTDEDVFSTGPDITEEAYGESDRRLSEYRSILTPLDREIYDINSEINNKKQEILTIYNNAIGAGCSIGSTTSTINGVSLGIGFTITQDSAQIRQYSGLYDSDDDDPFREEQVDLTLNNLSRGYENVNIDNSGSYVGSYRNVNSWLGGPIIPTPTEPCITYVNQINTLATEIASLRIDRETNVTDINYLKGAKLDDEIGSWAYSVERRGVEESRVGISSVIEIVNQSSLLD